jgi:hypothetical protein
MQFQKARPIGKTYCMASMVGYLPGKFPRPQCCVTRSAEPHCLPHAGRLEGVREALCLVDNPRSAFASPAADVPVRIQGFTYLFLFHGLFQLLFGSMFLYLVR